jgi:hypothetical protein
MSQWVLLSIDAVGARIEAKEEKPVQRSNRTHRTLLLACTNERERGWSHGTSIAGTEELRNQIVL